MGPVRPSAPMGGTRVLFVGCGGPGGSQRSYGWDRTPCLASAMLIRGGEGHGPPPLE